MFFDKPSYAPRVEQAFGFDTRQIPSGNLQISPRFGFNWDATGDQKNQIRGGAGLFQGIPAYVWMSNQFQNSGVGLAQFSCGGTNLTNNGASACRSSASPTPRRSAP